jgi:hypothetical protein
MKPLFRLSACLLILLAAAAGLSAQAAAPIAFADAGARLLKAIYPSGFGPDDNPAPVSVVDERQGADNRADSAEGFVTGVLIQQVSFAASAQTAAWQVIEGDFIVNALQEKEKAADKDIPWEQAKNYGDFTIVKYVLSCDARKTGANWLLSLRVVDLQSGTNKGSSQVTVKGSELDELIKAHSAGSLAALQPGLRQSMGQGLKAAAALLKKKSGEPVALATGNLLYAERDVGGPAAQFLLNELEMAMGASGKVVRLPDGEKPSSKALATLKARLPDLKMDGMVEGRYYDEGDAVRLYWTMLSYPSGEVLAQGSLQFRRSDIPASLVLEPPANPVPSHQLANVSQGTAVDRDFKVELSSNHGNGGTYLDGEMLQLYVRATKDCYIKIYHFDVKGNRQLIFPNSFMKDNFIKAGALLPFPGPNAPFQFLLHEPFGTERIKVVASTTPFLNQESDFTATDSLGTGTEGMTRGLSVVPKTATAEAQLSYVIQAR